MVFAVRLGGGGVASWAGEEMGVGDSVPLRLDSMLMMLFRLRLWSFVACLAVSPPFLTLV